MCWVCVLLLASSDGACINRNNTLLEAKHCRAVRGNSCIFMKTESSFLCLQEPEPFESILHPCTLPYFFNIHFNTVSHLYLSHPRGLFLSVVQKHLYWKSHTRIYPPPFDHPNIFCWIIQNVRLLIMQFSQVACYFLWQICSKYTDSFWGMSVWLQPVASRWW